MFKFNGRIIGATFIRGFSQKAMKNLFKVFEFEITFLSLTLEKSYETSALKLQTSYWCKESQRAIKE